MTFEEAKTKALNMCRKTATIDVMETYAKDGSRKCRMTYLHIDDKCVMAPTLTACFAQFVDDEPDDLSDFPRDDEDLEG